ncbi:MAG: hypothetical protein JNK37_08335 [Verrucomicrobiales bacterium]|nr:hypothetical protein [Verrucomicrobiales bacterium]
MSTEPKEGGTAYQNERMPGPGLPPWLWIWLAFWLWSLPNLWSQIKWGWSSMMEARTRDLEIAAQFPDMVKWKFLTYPGYLLESLPGIALAISVCLVFLPYLRARWVERKLSLGPPTQETESLTEIRRFVGEFTNRLTITQSLRPGQLAMIYPNRFRRAVLGVFSGFLILWKRDRRTAEGVLIHEITHLRCGDPLLIGVGSPVRGAIIWSLLAFVLLIEIPILIEHIDGYIRAREEMGSAGISGNVQKSGRGTFLSFGGFLLAQLFVFGGHLGLLLAPFTMPIMAIWCAELNADLATSRFLGPAGKEGRFLEQLRQETRWYRRCLAWLTHPPRWMRRWVMRQPGRFGMVTLLCLFPAGYLLKLFLICLGVILPVVGTKGFAALYGETVLDGVWGVIFDGAKGFLASLALPLIILAILTGIWPWLCSRWEAFFTGGPRPLLKIDRLPYFFAAGLIMIAACVCTSI